MTKRTRRGRPGAPPPADAGLAVPLARDDAFADEVSAVGAIVAVLATANLDDEPSRGDGPFPDNEVPSRSPWNAPARMVRTSYPHGPGGWRASVSPR